MITDPLTRCRVFCCQRHQRFVPAPWLSGCLHPRLLNSCVTWTHQTLQSLGKLLHIIRVTPCSRRKTVGTAENCHLIVIFYIKEWPCLLWKARSFWPCNIKLISGLVISSDADDAIKHLVGPVDQFSCLISSDLVELPFGPLHRNVFIKKLGIDFWRRLLGQFHVCRVN